MTEEILQATHGSPDHPLRIGDLEIPCYVLEDGTRVLALGGMLKALDMSLGGAGGASTEGQDRLARFASTTSIKPFINSDLANRINNPIRFRAPSGGTLANGYEATILTDLCDAVLAAREAKKLRSQQQHIAKRCEIVTRGLARIGIIGLVDEATGYQEVRSRRALEEILDRFITEELRKWAKTFPDDFYREMFRLRGWQYVPFTVKRPGIVAHYTNDLVYERLAPGVLEELKLLNPIDEKGRRRNKHFHYLTEDVGHPRLREHLAAVIALMRASANWPQFSRAIQRALPKYNSTIEMSLDD